MNGGVDEKGWLKCRPVVGVCHNWLVMFGPVPPHRVEAQRGGLTFIGGLKGFQRTKEEHKCPHAPCWLSAYAAFITPSTINRTACPLVVKQKNLPPPPCAPAGGSRSSAIGRQRAWALERVQSAGRPFSPIKRRSLTRKRMSRVLIGSLWWSFKATPPPTHPATLNLAAMLDDSDLLSWCWPKLRREESPLLSLTKLAADPHTRFAALDDSRPFIGWQSLR